MDQKEVVFRDDDIHYLTDLKQFSKVHDLFIKYDVQHTIALIAKDIDKNQELIDYIKANKIEVQLHCWKHILFTKNTDIIKEQLQLGIQKIEELFGKKPTIVYPPWNETNDLVNYIAKEVGLEVSVLKVGINHYVKAQGNIDLEGCNTINFHYWSGGDTMFLEQALEIYKERQVKCL